MDPQVIDAQFDRAVQIVQSLPKNGPIQTGYEEKLVMYRYVQQVKCSGFCTTTDTVYLLHTHLVSINKARLNNI